MISDNQTEKIYKDKRICAIIKVLRAAYPRYLWSDAILYLSKRDHNQHLSIASMYGKIDLLLIDGIVETCDIDIGGMRNTFDKLVEMGILNRGEFHEPYEPEVCYRLANAGRRVSTSDQKKKYNPDNFIFNPIPA